MKNTDILKNTFYAQTTAYVAVSATATLSSLIDGIIIGQYLGVDSTAAFGIVNPLLMILALIGAVLSIGARSRFVYLIGAGKTKQAQNVFSVSLILSAAAALATTVIVIAFSTPITRLLGASGSAASLLPKARAYMIGMVLGMPARNVMWVLQAFAPIDNDHHLPVIASAAMTAVNILLDLAVVPVLHGDMFEMGVVTSISCVVALLILMMHFAKKDTFLKLSFKNISWSDTGELFTEGIPTGLHSLGHMIINIFMNRLLVSVAAAAAVAAYSVYGQAESLLLPIAAGIADTVSALSGALNGEENRPMIKKLLVTSVKASLLCTLLLSALAWIFAPMFAGCFIRNDPEALRMSVRAIRAYSLGLTLHGFITIYQEYLDGTGKMVFSSVSVLLSECGFPILCAAVTVKWLGADSVWCAFPAAQVLSLICFFAAVPIENRRLNIHANSIFDKLLLLPDNFDVSEENCMDRSITTMAEVTDLSQAVWHFCNDHGCDERRKFLMSLAVEEMAGNIITHGFSKGKKMHSIDVRIIHKDEDFIIRIRDNCTIFDPVNQLRLYSDDDLAHHIGLRMIIGMSKLVRYTSIMRSNNLFIRV